MNENQISLAGKIKNEINLTIKKELKERYKGEASYSRCRVQEGYYDTFALECGRRGFSMSYSDSYYETSELGEDELKGALPLIVKGVEEEFLDEKNLPVLLGARQRSRMNASFTYLWGTFLICLLWVMTNLRL